MSDYDSQLPVRSKQDVDERVLTKIQDGDNPDGANETMTVSEKKAHVRMHGKDAGGVDRETLHSEEGHVQSNGDYDAVSNTRPSSQGLIASDRAAAPDETTMNKRPTAVAGDDDKVAIDCAISDSSGNRIDENNPLAVFFSDNPGQEVQDFDRAENVAKNATADHDYTVTAATELRKLNVEASASGKAKFELQIETAPAAGTFDTVGVKFNSTANPNVRFELSSPKPVAAGVIVKLIKTNLDNGAQDIYSTINGVEV
jgi:hypothetical protein